MEEEEQDDDNDLFVDCATWSSDDEPMPQQDPFESGKL
jgi:hypothetical protein